MHAVVLYSMRVISWKSWVRRVFGAWSAPRANAVLEHAGFRNCKFPPLYVLSIQSMHISRSQRNRTTRLPQPISQTHATQPSLLSLVQLIVTIQLHWGGGLNGHAHFVNIFIHDHVFVCQAKGLTSMRKPRALQGLYTFTRLKQLVKITVWVPSTISMVCPKILSKFFF